MKFKRNLFFVLLLFLSFVVPPGTEEAYASIPTAAKGMWIWQIWTLENGSLDSIISRLKSSGVTWVAVKLGDSNSLWDSPGNTTLYPWAQNYGGFANVITMFHDNGIKVYGWQYIYGTNEWGGGGSEAGVTNEILDIPGIDGFIIDAEAQFEGSGMTAVAAQYISAVRSAHPDSYIALTSFARVSGFPIPWTTFLAGCNANMPQAYWALRPTSVSAEFAAMKSAFETAEETWINQGDIDAIKPIVPIGCENSQGESSYQMHYGDIQQFADLCQGSGYVGMSLWDYTGMDTMNWRDYSNSWTKSVPAPSITGTSPAVADSFPAYDSVEVDFNIPMDAESINKAFNISPSTNGKIIMNPDLDEWTFVPDTLLNWSTKYTITIDTSAANLLGAHLAAPYSFAFTTVPKDTTGPTVIAVSPRNGGTCVSKAYVEFILNEPVKLGSILSQITFADSAGNNVPFTKDILEVTTNPGNPSSDLTLIALRTLINLTPGMKYTVTLAKGVSDYYNVASKSPYSTTFTVDTNETSGGAVLEGFESSLGNWQQPYASPLTSGVDSSSSNFALAYRAFDGYQAGALTYAFDSTQALCAEVNSQGYNISGISSVGMWVFGDNSGNQLDYILGASPVKVVPVDTIDWYGYKFIGMWRDQTDTSTNVFRGFAVRRLPSAILDNGTIYVDDIQVNGEVTDVKEPVAQLPASFRLLQNYPNPFNPTTTISYQLPAAVHVNLKIFDVIGREVATLVNATQNAGSHVVTFNASDLPSGVYFYRLNAGTDTAIRKMLMIK